MATDAQWEEWYAEIQDREFHEAIMRQCDEEDAAACQCSPCPVCGVTGDPDCGEKHMWDALGYDDLLDMAYANELPRKPYIVEVFALNVLAWKLDF
jgi:hypothetical protein